MCEGKMITSKIEKRRLLLFILLVVGLLLSLIGLAVSLGEQHPAVERFRWVFYLSVFGTIIFAVLLALGLVYLKKYMILPKR